MVMLEPVNPAAGRCNAKARDSILCLFGLSFVGLLRCCIESCIWETVPCLHFTSILVGSRCIRSFFFNTQGSVHRKYIPTDIFPTRCNITPFIYF